MGAQVPAHAKELAQCFMVYTSIMTNDKYDYVMRRIERMVVSDVARQTKLSRRTIQNLKASRYEARHATINKLYDYLKQRDSK